MRFLALVTDYDGTLAENGKVSARTVNTLRQLREGGRRLVLVTGRELSDLVPLFPEHTLFDRIVGENGGVLWAPDSREVKLLGEPPPEGFVERLRELGVPVSVGRVIVATHEPHETTVLDVIRELGVELQVIFNKGAVMILPSGVNKATGLRAALAELGLSAHNAVAVGDAENDHTLLSECEAAVAVDNALPTLKERADWVTRGESGDGVAELAEQLLTTDLRELSPRLRRHDVAIGKTPSGDDVTVQPYGPRILVCGASGSGKSTLVTTFLEGLSDSGYRYCLIDPEGDFTNAPAALVVGDERKEPTADEVIEVLRAGESSVVANLLGVALAERPRVLSPLLARLMENRIRYGTPHFIVVDEAHHMMPEGDVTLSEALASVTHSVLLVTVHPERIAKSVLEQLDHVFVVGKNAGEPLRAFAERANVGLPVSAEELAAGEVYYWQRAAPDRVARFRVLAPKTERRRHQRKYASGELGEDKSFYFRGPEGSLNLRAHNLSLFLQIAEGVDDATWTHHLLRHDYSRWLKDAIKDEALSKAVFAVEADRSLAASPRESRRRIRCAIEDLYTLPA
ncbi:MAG TPA: HAD-IIB family hydrolase [Polyangiaceae bacterium]|nr:HAD-IIB family hydrolase [Polyangiaceae bacterium]